MKIVCVINLLKILFILSEGGWMISICGLHANPHVHNGNDNNDEIGQFGS